MLTILTTPQVLAFPDITLGSILEQHISTLIEAGILSGYPDGTFKPERTINRAEALKIIFSAQGISADDPYESSFPDVSREDWFSPYVGIARSHGIVAGYPDGNFRPGQIVNRAEFLKMVISSMPVIVKTPEGMKLWLEDFSDIDQRQWYAPYLASAVQLDLLPGMGKFRPIDGMKRGEAAEIIYELANHLQEGQSLSEHDSTFESIPENAFVVSDPTVEHPYHPAEFAPDKLTVEKDIGKTEINNRYGAYRIVVDEIVDVKNLEVSPDQLTITYPNGCVVDIHTKDNSLEHLSPENYFQNNFDDSSFMNPPKSKSLEKVGKNSGFQAYKMLARWSDHIREDYFIHTAEKIYGLNGFSFGKKTDQDCNNLSNTIISHFELL